jgi:hypothetical protein
MSDTGRALVCRYQIPVTEDDLRPIPQVVAPFTLSPFKEQKPLAKWFFKDTIERQNLGLLLEDVLEDIRRGYDDSWELFGKIKFARAATEQEADIIIQFSPTPAPEAGSATWDNVTLADTVYPNTGTPDAGHMYINPNIKWVSWFGNTQRGIPIPGDSYDLGTMIIHEEGHSVGLAHSMDPTAVMYAYYHFIQFPFKLPKDDQLAIRALTGENTVWSDGLKQRLLTNQGYTAADIAP